MSNSMVEMIDNRIHNIFSVPEAYALSPFDLEGFRDHLLFTILKDSYDIVVPKQSVRASRGSDADDLRMRDSRIKAYAQYYRDLQYKRIKENTGIEVPELLSKDVSSMKGKLSGHQLSEMQYSASKEEWAEIEDKLYQYFTAEYYIKNEIVRKWTLSEFFARYSTKAQWADFIRQHYDLRKIYVPREWTNKRIRYIRKIYQAIVRDIEPPKL